MNHPKQFGAISNEAGNSEEIGAMALFLAYQMPHPIPQGEYYKLYGGTLLI